MRSFIFLSSALLLTACATTPVPPQIAEITFISMERATITETIIGSGDYSEEYDAPGYKVRFASDLKMTTPPYLPETSFHGVEFYECESERRYDSGHAYSARDYFSLSSSSADLIEEKSDRGFIYEAELSEDVVRLAQGPLCVKIFVHDGNVKRKVWLPAFISNEMELKRPA